MKEIYTGREIIERRLMKPLEDDRCVGVLLLEGDLDALIDGLESANLRPVAAGLLVDLRRLRVEVFEA